MPRRRTLTATTSVAALGLLLLTACDSGEDAAPQEEQGQEVEQEVEQDEAHDAGHDADHDADRDDAAVSDDHNAADVDYAQGMIAHHEQAIEMSEILLENEGLDPELESLAEDIKAAQGPEIEQMNSWLEAWEDGEHADHEAEGHATDGHATDGQGGHDGHGDSEAHGGHDGMLTEDQLLEFTDAEGAEAERLFLEGVILHHEGAVEMAEEHLEQGQNPEALELSEQVIEDQSEEIELMEGLLEDY
ncbi:DUF305 domain-containing protein [Nesterenkonia sp. CL21]|uniref:DUF305 domain-containing protein n=1 Tax=Nesterenkonia sp. CL21 TaxID=3064894 RepID=UPI00287B5482|nr:DUF305 domain-containing protein [Nesterenkonia sp. CL21]MDS2172828.1 DUF305 domain-containing protein [Nesterenkonia sp. CL21]